VKSVFRLVNYKLLKKIKNKTQKKANNKKQTQKRKQKNNKTTQYQNLYFGLLCIYFFYF